MKKILSLSIVLVSIVTFACTWNPSVAAVPITAPWDSMHLPVKEDARVWASSANELKVAHKGDKASTLAAYEKALNENGWKSAGSPGSGTVLFRKDGKE